MTFRISLLRARQSARVALGRSLGAERALAVLDSGTAHAVGYPVSYGRPRTYGITGRLNF